MEQSGRHTVRLEDRSELTMTGIVEVLSYDDGYMELSLEDGGVTVEGEGLRITEFDSERRVLTARGAVVAVMYIDRAAKKKRGFFGRDKT